MNALDRLIELGEANNYDEMSTAEFVIYADWILAKREGKDIMEYLNEAAEEIVQLRAVVEAAKDYVDSRTDQRKKFPKIQLLMDALAGLDERKAQNENR